MKTSNASEALDKALEAATVQLGVPAYIDNLKDFSLKKVEFIKPELLFTAGVYRIVRDKRVTLKFKNKHLNIHPYYVSLKIDW